MMVTIVNEDGCISAFTSRRAGADYVLSRFGASPGHEDDRHALGRFIEGRAGDTETWFYIGAETITIEECEVQSAGALS